MDRGRITAVRHRWCALWVCLALVATVVSISPRVASARDDVSVSPQVLDALAAGESVQLIVSGHRDPAGAAGRMALQPGLGVEVEHVFRGIDAVLVTVDSVDELGRLIEHPAVRAITPGAERATRYLDESRALTGVDTSHGAGVLGSGVTVAVIDGGVQADHPDLAGGITFEACFVLDPETETGHCADGAGEAFGPGSAPDDSQSHGTYMAGIVASRGNLAPLGIAPAANLEIYKLFEEAAGGFLSDLVRTLEFIADDRPDVDVVNMSFGFETSFVGTCDEAYPALFDAIEVLRARGVVFVAASGNESLAAMSAPACLSNVVSVAASGDVSEEPDFNQVAELSNVSAVTDLAAPGTQVLTSATGSTTELIIGTSASAAHVSGCAALVRASGLRTAPATEARVRTSSTIAANPGGLSLPIVDCAVGPPPTGNVNCDGGTDVVDGLVIAQFVVGIRNDAGACPLTDPLLEIDASQGDLNGDGATNIIDALLITQCVVGIDNPYC